MYMYKQAVLSVTTDKVLEAAKNCPQAAAVLKVLFPEAFSPKLVELDNTHQVILRDKTGLPVLQLRDTGEYKGQIYLSVRCTWKLVIDTLGVSVLVGTEREGL